MTHLQEIRQTAQETAEAITAALSIDIEITDETLTIVAGTGRYKQKIGSKEEEGDLESGYLYAEALRTAKTYIIEEVSNHPTYDPKENELAEVCCPILLGDKVIGLMGLVAFNEGQRDRLLKDKDNMIQFLKIMAGLLASKVAEHETSSLMKAILQSTHDGILSVNEGGIITSANLMAEKLLQKRKGELEDSRVSDIWPDLPLLEAIKKDQKILDQEVIIFEADGKANLFSATVSPIQTGMTGAVISFRDMADVRKLVVRLTEADQPSSFQELLGYSRQIEKLREIGKKIAGSQSTVLITGESGTGKGLLARAIHSASAVSQGPLVTINCGAIPDTLLETELFGYEGGAFTDAARGGKVGKFELANDGTLFLDEIGDLPLHLQVKLLHVLQHRKIQRVGGTRSIPVNVRLIAATNRKLEEMVKEKAFREDLYFRLNVIPMHIPPLRERREDIDLLLNQSLIKYCELNHKEMMDFERDVLDILHRYDWPGNIRELENVVEYGVTMETGRWIRLENLPMHLREWQEESQPIGPLKDQLNAREKNVIQECLKMTGYSLEGKRKAARILQVSESTLYRRLRELGIDKQGNE